jgi:hypothetical protein
MEAMRDGLGCCRNLEEPIVVVVAEEMQALGVMVVQVLYF